MRRENMDFGEALRLLAERAGVELEPLSVGAIEGREERDRLREINAAAAQHYHRLLMESPAGEAARQYLARRGVTQETMVTFQLGYAPDEWRSAEGHLAPIYGHEDLLTAGIISQSDRGGHYDRFRNRLMFPIRDSQGHVIGFGGRVLDDSVPKYLNSPDTPLFDKGSVLYGIDLAREAIRESGTVVVVEGYMDVVVPYQFGVRNLVACLGTALTESHIQLLRRMVRVLILALDPDAAGIRATERGIETAQHALDRKTVPVLTPSGAVRYESRLDAEVRVLALPDGLDPDELVLQDRERWDQLVAEAQPVASIFPAGPRRGRGGDGQGQGERRGAAHAGHRGHREPRRAPTLPAAPGPPRAGGRCTAPARAGPGAAGCCGRVASGRSTPGAAAGPSARGRRRRETHRPGPRGARGCPPVRLPRSGGGCAGRGPAAPRRVPPCHEPGGL